MKKKRKARVTKEMAHQFAEDQKLTTAKRKKIIVPGPWTNLDPTFTVNAAPRKHQPIIMTEPYFGVYREDNNWNEKAWFPISINVTFPNMPALVKEFGLDLVLAAAEKSLTEQKIYGNLILLYVVADNSQRPTDPFISCRAKTNKRNILGFAALRNQVLTVLTKANQDAPIDSGNTIQTSPDL